MQTQLAEIKQFFTTTETAKLSGLSVSMLNYLFRTQIVMPTARGRRGRGSPRRYSFGDVVVLRVIAGLLRGGVSAERLKKQLRAFRRYHREITPQNLPGKFLITDGITVFRIVNDATMEALDESGQYSFRFIVGLERARAEVIEAHQQLGTE